MKYQSGFLRRYSRHFSALIAACLATSALQIQARTAPIPIVVAASPTHACAVKSDGTVWCWGDNVHHEVGDTPLSSVSLPTRVYLEGPARSVVTGVWHSCALLNSGAVECWGNNGASELGITPFPPTDYPTPQHIAGLAGAATAIAAGFNHTCALVNHLGTKAVQCWGENTYWQLGTTAGYLIGTGDIANPVPQYVTAAEGATAITAGAFFSCAMIGSPLSPTAGASVQCWGHNMLGDLGRGYTSAKQLPDKNQTVGLPGGAFALHAGPDSNFACARIQNGQLRCWGSGTPTPVAMPGMYQVTDFAQSGWGDQCVVASGGVLCALNSGSVLLNSNPPMLMMTPILSGATAVATGADYACAIVGAGINVKIQCWGANQSGQLGNGTFVDSPFPVDVLL